MATRQQQIDFVNYIAPIIKKIGNERGYKIVSPFIAMSLKEGNFGQSSLAKRYHNHFGMKAGSSWKGEVVNLKTMEEYTVGKLTQIVDGFRCYPNDIAGVNGFFDFISTKRYSLVKEQNTPMGIVVELKKAGYMTSSTYVNSIINDYIPSFDLTRYDDVNMVVDIKPTPVATNSYPTLKLNSKGNDVVKLQTLLNQKGYDCGKADGIFGIKTYYVVRRFQEANKLAIDGIVGRNTWNALDK